MSESVLGEAAQSSMSESVLGEAAQSSMSESVLGEAAQRIRFLLNLTSYPSPLSFLSLFLPPPPSLSLLPLPPSCLPLQGTPVTNTHRKTSPGGKCFNE